MLDYRTHSMNGRPLCGVQDVALLDWECSSSSYLYHAAHSCGVKRSNIQRWHAYCLVDTHCSVYCTSDSTHKQLQRQDTLKTSLELNNAEQILALGNRSIPLAFMMYSLAGLTCTVYSTEKSTKGSAKSQLPLLGASASCVYLILDIVTVIYWGVMKGLRTMTGTSTPLLCLDIECEDSWLFVTTSPRQIKATILLMVGTSFGSMKLSEGTGNALRGTRNDCSERDESTTQMSPSDAAARWDTDTKNSDGKQSAFELLSFHVPDQQIPDTGLNVRPTGFASGSTNSHSILPTYTQRTSITSAHSDTSPTLHSRNRRARLPEVSISLQERDVRLRGDGDFIYVCMGGHVFCRLIELNAKEFANDEVFLKELNKRCRSEWGQLWLLVTMSASDRVQLKQFHFLSNSPQVRCGRTSSLPPVTHEQYCHQGPDVTCREDMIAHDLRKCSEHHWVGSPDDTAVDRIYPGQERIIMNAIPKKVPYRLEYLKGHEGWGLHISLRLCYFRLAICMAGWAALSSASVALLLGHQVGSLQDAVVPAGISLTLFLFYVGLMAGLRK